MSPDNAAPPAKQTTNMAGVGRWNRKKRGVAKKQHHQGPKAKMTKEDRRSKYTAIARERQQRHKAKDLVCYHCREKGHSIHNCPQATSSTKKNKKLAAAIICYKCGSTEHTLSQCKKKKDDNDDALPFATCFICREQGHLASSCAKNEHGIYINGGACKHCGSKQHRGTDCNERKSKQKNEKQAERGGRVEEVDINDLLEGTADDDSKDTTDKKRSNAPPKTVSNGNQASAEKKGGKKRRVVNF